ncbi:TRAP transporter small permease subunit [Vibrio sp. TH_r3]|uniref:TRAP transporter small permease n=1 Tax=Vibrio sp. TH_r3 TaxID=3082084 RepID=UPI00295477DE|nr:TRAP transporter small permease subunit [Vibrio sp. TH_r3]MDV7105101.1 TRAP transporter small permease subunit [Vibrio sp. TH_r3]
MLISMFNKLIDGIGKLEMTLALSCLTFTVLGILCQVIMRTFFDAPIAWIEEALTYAFIWLVFISASYAWKKNSHIRIDAIFILVKNNRKITHLIEIIVNGLMVSLLVIMAISLMDIIPIESRMKTVALPIKLPKSYFYSIPLMISTLSLLMTSINNIVNECSKLYLVSSEVSSCQ